MAFFFFYSYSYFKEKNISFSVLGLQKFFTDNISSYMVISQSSSSPFLSALTVLNDLSQSTLFKH